MRRFMMAVASTTVVLGSALVAVAQPPVAPGGAGPAGAPVKAVQAPAAVQAPVQAPGKVVQAPAPVQAPKAVQAPAAVQAPMAPVQKPVQAPIQKHSVAQVQSPVQKGAAPVPVAPVKTARVGMFGRYRG